MDVALQEELLVLALKDKLPESLRLNQKQFVAKVGKEKFRDGAEMIYAYLEDACGSNLSRNETLALLSTALRCLSNYMTSVLNIPVTIKTIWDSLHLLPYAVNLSFPGYAAAGLLRAVITPRSISNLAKAS